MTISFSIEKRYLALKKLWLSGTCRHRLTPIAIVVSFSLSACDSGNSTHLDDLSDVLANQPVNSAAVIIEERKGKTHLDAWFYSGTEQSSPSVVTTVNAPLADTCEIDRREPLEQVAPKTSIDNSLSIVNGMGNIASIDKMEHGDWTVYSSKDRWLDDPIPSDSYIVFDQGSEFELLGSIALPTLVPLKWIEPVTGVMNSSSQVLRWEATASTDTYLHLNISAIDTTSGGDVPLVFECSVVDDGEYKLPNETQVAFSNFDNLLLRAYRVRQRNFESEGQFLSVTQLSHAVQ